MYKIGEVWSALNPYLQHYDKKWKHHLCVCDKRGMFLLLSTTGERQGIMYIPQQPYLPKKKRGFVCCNKVYYFSPEELTKFRGKLRGKFPKALLTGLMDHLSVSKTLPLGERDDIVDILVDFLSK